MMRKDAKPPITRPSAMGARPQPTPVAERSTGKLGELNLVVEFARPGWQRRLGAPATCRRTFVLDGLGREVYEACDGRRTVAQIATRFARAHRVSAAEAEQSVAAYFKTLMSKGLIAMVMDRKESA